MILSRNSPIQSRLSYYQPDIPHYNSSSPSSNSLCSTSSIESASSSSSISSAGCSSGDSLALGTNLLDQRSCPLISRSESSGLSYTDISETRQHPRRCIASKSQSPPSLVRQSDRKGQFVENLVESATTLVAAIWPMSEPACPAIPGFSQSHSVLPLKTYIQETLKRSKTRFSTLQVALYYLVILKEFIPPCDFTMEQPDNNPHRIALQCGRRMFLTALILASKYLQDRNYSAKAWSKITGLQVKEINLNEIAFLLAIQWKLHVHESTFERWQNILIRYSNPHMKAHWGAAVLNLSSDLESLPPVPSFLPTPPPSPPYLEPLVVMPPPESLVALRIPERRPSPMSDISSVCSSPAASTVSRGAMCTAMSIAALTARQRGIQDYGDATKAFEAIRPPTLTLDTSQAINPPKLFSYSSSNTSPTSPGSMISDHSSQSSRSSSISSASSNSPPQDNLLHRAMKNAMVRKLNDVPNGTYDNSVTVLGSLPLVYGGECSITTSPEVIPEPYDEPIRYSRKRPIRVSFDGDVTTLGLRDGCDYSKLQQEVRGLLLRPLVDSTEQIHPRQFPLSCRRSKRACIDVAYAESTSYSRPLSGPGMWNGLL